MVHSYTTSITDTRYYVGPIEFVKGSGKDARLTVDRVNLPWGYFRADGWDNVNLTDYQGNIRAVARNSYIIDHIDYYPYGLPKASAPGSVSRYKYSGKEFETRGGLDFYDFDARLQLPAVGLFSRPDPLAGDNPGVNTYLYCNANPIMLIDPTGEYAFENIKEGEEYKVIAVFPSNYKKLDEAEGSHALENTYKAAQEAGMPIMLVDNIEDFATALNDFAESGSSTDIFTLNSHGNDGAFFIGEDMVNALTDVSALKEGLAATNVVIIACRAGANAEGDALLKSFSKQTQSTVIGSNNNIPSRYAYDGGNGLSYKQPLPTPIYGVNKGNDFKMSGVGQRPVTIYNVAIHKTKGLSWDNGFKFRFSDIWNSWKQ
ncbi:MAG: RHS repeat-associated core domain-containing protein [Muribaculaceae bacterium]|nr:RHS repeat-associated core domain-containing protein [Muribaculaceae bacterium]